MEDEQGTGVKEKKQESRDEDCEADDMDVQRG